MNSLFKFQQFDTILQKKVRLRSISFSIHNEIFQPRAKVFFLYIEKNQLQVIYKIRCFTECEFRKIQQIERISTKNREVSNNRILLLFDLNRETKSYNFRSNFLVRLIANTLYVEKHVFESEFCLCNRKIDKYRKTHKTYRNKRLLFCV